MVKNRCPCGSSKLVSHCCGIYLSGQSLPETAEQLMRSRYTAYCQGNIDYLIATLHPQQRKFDDRIELTRSIKNTTWLSLQIINVDRGQKNDHEGYVEFVAVYQAQTTGQLHERSQFIRENGRWFYLTGEFLPALTPKRNELCWCGSRKKFKNCHGKK